MEKKSLHQLRESAGVLFRVVVLLPFVFSLATNSTGNFQAQGNTPALEIKAPAQVEVGEPIDIEISVIHVPDLAGYETALLFDTAAAEYGGLQQRQNDLKKIGRDVSPLTAVDLPGGVSFGLASCSFENCVTGQGPRQDRGGNGRIKLATVTLFGLQPGSLEIRLDATKFVDAAGNPVQVNIPNPTIVVQVGGNDPYYPAPGSMWALPSSPAANPGPVDLTGDGVVDHADAMEVSLEWELSRLQVAPCGPHDPSRDLNQDGCVDVSDLQMMLANFGAPGNSAGPRAANPGEAGQAPSADLSIAVAQTFTVNSIGDGSDAAWGDGICATSAGDCTLRAAIAEANAHLGPDTIVFNIPGSGVKTIILTQRLPTLNDTSGGTTIDGYTQPGSAPNTDALISNASIMVQFEGGGETNFDGLVITTSGNSVRGLSFYKLRRSFWIYGSGASGNRITGNFIGTNASGTYRATIKGQPAHGLHIEQGAPGNQVGDTSPAGRNVISGNGLSGVGFWHEGTDNNVIFNNIIGLSPRGDRRLSNQQHGVDINFGAAFTTVGGTGSGERNVASGNIATGLEVSHTAGTTGNRVVGNYVGTTLDGTQAPSYTNNNKFGIVVKDRVVNNTVSNNVVGNNREGGIIIDEYGHCCVGRNVISNNRVGISVDGRPIGNSVFGIKSIASLAQIGPGNIIANNPVGIQIDGSSNDRNTITQNSIYNNTGLGIDLGPLDSVNMNDAGDGDSGPNEQLNFPVLQSATTSQVSGTACANCTVEIFIADGGEGAYGEGRTFIGSGTANGSGSFNVAVSGAAGGNYITATATDSNGNTSEFSLNIQVGGGQSPTPTPPPPGGSTVASDSFTRNVTNGWGSADTGGSYTVSGTTSNYSVNGSTGLITIPGPGIARKATLDSVSALNSDITFRLRTDHLPSGNSVYAYFISRKVSSNTEYRGQIRLATTGSVYLRVVRVDAGTAASLGTEVLVPNFNQTSNSYLWVHAQVDGTNPTTIRIKAWADGQPEPASWQFIVTDSTASLQAAGSVGLMANVPSTVTNAPLVFSFDNFLVTALP